MMKAKPLTSKQKMRDPEHAQYRISADEFLPLELDTNLHICLWSEDETHKWTVATIENTNEGPFLKSAGERILDERINWKLMRELIKLGFAISWHNFNANEIRLNRERAEHGVYS